MTSSRRNQEPPSTLRSSPIKRTLPVAASPLRPSSTPAPARENALCVKQPQGTSIRSTNLYRSGDAQREGEDGDGAEARRLSQACGVRSANHELATPSDHRMYSPICSVKFLGLFFRLQHSCRQQSGAHFCLPSWLCTTTCSYRRTFIVLHQNLPPGCILVLDKCPWVTDSYSLT